MREAPAAHVRLLGLCAEVSEGGVPDIEDEGHAPLPAPARVDRPPPVRPKNTKKDKKKKKKKKTPVFYAILVPAHLYFTRCASESVQLWADRSFTRKQT